MKFVQNLAKMTNTLHPCSSKYQWARRQLLYMATEASRKRRVMREAEMGSYIAPPPCKAPVWLPKPRKGGVLTLVKSMLP